MGVVKGSIDLHIPLSRPEIKRLVWHNMEYYVELWQRQWDGDSRGRFFYEVNSKVIALSGSMGRSERRGCT